jgi:hypothetical protein
MHTREIQQYLIAAFEEFEIIDAHEHLPPEHVRTSQPVDALTLFSHYCRTDLVTAGMSPEAYERMKDGSVDLEERWKSFSPFLPFVRFGSYARPAFLAAKEFYGFDDINDSNYVALTEAMRAANTPGIYHRILREKCKIRTALTQQGRTDYDGDLLVPLMPVDTYAGVTTWQAVQERAHDMGQVVNTLDDYLGVIEAGLLKWKGEGAVGLKMRSSPYPPATRADAHSLFEKLRTGEQTNVPGMSPLFTFLLDGTLDLAAKHNLVVAVHAGMWGDFRQLDSQHLIPIVQRHPNTRFDLYHMGMPEVRQTGVIGKNFPNVWLNLCWCHIISQRMTVAALDEWLDMVPANKILAFGGDYGKPVEKVYGHLVMAREDIALVLARRVRDGPMTESQAVEVARRWFWDNPKELYGL